MMSKLAPFLMFVFACSQMSGCAPTALEAQEKPVGPKMYDFPIKVVVQDTNEKPVPGAIVKIEGKEAGKTGNSGVFEVKFKERRKVQIDIEVEPPDGYQLLANQQSGTTEELVVTKNGDELKVHPIRFTVAMESMKKDNLVWVRLDCDDRLSCADIPILMSGQVVATTNDFGVAHFVGENVPDRQVELMIDTPDNVDGKYIFDPADPKFAFKASLTPTVYYIEEKFTNLVPEPVYVPAFRGKSGKKSKARKKSRKKSAKKKTSKKKKTKVPVLGDGPKKKEKKKTKKKKESDSGPIELF